MAYFLFGNLSGGFGALVRTEASEAGRQPRREATGHPRRINPPAIPGESIPPAIPGESIPRQSSGIRHYH